MRDPNREKKVVQASSNLGEKNMEMENSLLSTPGANLGSFSTGLGGKSPCIPQGEKQDPIRESQESVESDDTLHTSLLIDTMAQEQKLREESVSILNNGRKSVTHLPKNGLKSYSHVMRSSTQVNEMAEYKQDKLGGSSN